MRVDVKNYLIFSAVFALILSLIINFGFFETFKSSLVMGFPISLKGSSGISYFIIQLINTLISTVFFTPALYMLIRYLQSRR